MIENEKQYQVTKKWLEAFKQSRQAVEADENRPAEQKRIYLEAYASQIDELSEQIAEYEKRLHK